MIVAVDLARTVVLLLFVERDAIDVAGRVMLEATARDEGARVAAEVAGREVVVADVVRECIGGGIVFREALAGIRDRDLPAAAVGGLVVGVERVDGVFDAARREASRDAAVGNVQFNGFLVLGGWSFDEVSVREAAKEFFVADFDVVEEGNAKGLSSSVVDEKIRSNGDQTRRNTDLTQGVLVSPIRKETRRNHWPLAHLCPYSLYRRHNIGRQCHRSNSYTSACASLLQRPYSPACQMRAHKVHLLAITTSMYKVRIRSDIPIAVGGIYSSSS